MADGALLSPSPAAVVPKVVPKPFRGAKHTLSRGVWVKPPEVQGTPCPNHVLWPWEDVPDAGGVAGRAAAGRGDRDARPGFPNRLGTGRKGQVRASGTVGTGTQVGLCSAGPSRSQDARLPRKALSLQELNFSGGLREAGGLNLDGLRAFAQCCYKTFIVVGDEVRMCS